MKKFPCFVTMTAVLVTSLSVAETSPAAGKPKHHAVPAPAAIVDQSTRPAYGAGVGTAKQPLEVRVQTSPLTRADAEKDAAFREQATTNNATVRWARWGGIVALIQTIALVLTLLVSILVAIPQLRAYVEVRPKHVSSFDTTHSVSCDLDITNVGKTPARELTSVADIVIIPQPLPNGFSLPAPKETEQSVPCSLFPSRGLMMTRLNGRPFTEAELDGVRNGSMAICVYGTVRYKDVFHFKRVTNFSATVVATTEVLASLTTNYDRPDLKVTFATAPVFSAIT